jgi:hypothetical protein
MIVKLTVEAPCSGGVRWHNIPAFWEEIQKPLIAGLEYEIVICRLVITQM